jgi:hypothetical protein
MNNNTDLPLQIVEGTRVRRVDPDDPQTFRAIYGLMSLRVGPAGRRSRAFRRRRYRELISGPAPILHHCSSAVIWIAAGLRRHIRLAIPPT